MMMRAMLDGAAANAVRRVEAVVQTGDVETRYQVAGSGPAVLLLAADVALGPLGEALVGELAARFRVVAPARPATPLDPAEWLRGVIDGLGLMEPTLVADEAMGLAALGFAMTDPQRVRGLAIVSRAPRPGWLTAEAEDRLAVSGRPLLLLSVAGERGLDEAAAAGLKAFLDAADERTCD